MSNIPFLEAVQACIESATGEVAEIKSHEGAAGGCINTAQRIVLRDGRSFFIKSNPAPFPGMFEREAEGLRALGTVGTLRVPEPIATGGGEEGVPPFLILERIEKGTKPAGFSEDFGRRLARMHRQSASPRCGFASDNYIGSTPQPNTWGEDWIEFWREHRLGFQLHLAIQNGYVDADFAKLGERLLNKLDSLIAQPEESFCLLHGDLWGGNYLCDSAGSPVLIDPAVYYGRREADLAMTYLFGGFDSEFYAAYREEWPLADGYEVRIDIYKLYHLLNHLNLFGSSYRAGCETIMQRYA